MTASPSLKIKVLSLGEEGAPSKEYFFEKEIITLGRDKENDVALENKFVSRKHARITQKDTEYILQDLESTNGTFCKGKKVSSLRLKDKDQFSIGDFQIEVILDPQEISLEKEKVKSIAYPQIEEDEAQGIRVKVLLGTTLIKEYSFSKESITIGRLEKNDIVLSDSFVSRQHARISKEKEKYVLEDLKSSNGTFLNGDRVTFHELNNGDELVIGKFNLVFLLSEEGWESDKVVTFEVEPEVLPETKIVEIPSDFYPTTPTFLDRQRLQKGLTFSFLSHLMLFLFFGFIHLPQPEIKVREIIQDYKVRLIIEKPKEKPEVKVKKEVVKKEVEVKKEVVKEIEKKPEKKLVKKRIKKPVQIPKKPIKLATKQPSPHPPDILLRKEPREIKPLRKKVVFEETKIETISKPISRITSRKISPKISPTPLLLERSQLPTGFKYKYLKTSSLSELKEKEPEELKSYGKREIEAQDLSKIELEGPKRREPKAIKAITKKISSPFTSTLSPTEIEVADITIARVAKLEEAEPHLTPGRSPSSLLLGKPRVIEVKGLDIEETTSGGKPTFTIEERGKKITPTLTIDTEISQIVITDETGKDITSSSEGVKGRGLEEILKVVEEGCGGLNQLYNEHLKRNPEIKGRIEVCLSISPQGEVKKVKLTQKPGDEAFGQDFCEEIKNWKFPQVPETYGTKNVTIPFKLTIRYEE